MRFVSTFALSIILAVLTNVFCNEHKVLVNEDGTSVTMSCTKSNQRSCTLDCCKSVPNGFSHTIEDECYSTEACIGEIVNNDNYLYNFECKCRMARWLSISIIIILLLLTLIVLVIVLLIRFHRSTQETPSSTQSDPDPQSIIEIPEPPVKPSQRSASVPYVHRDRIH